MDKRYVLAWLFFDFLHFGGAAVCFVFAFIWRGLGPADLTLPNLLLRRLVVSEKDSLAAAALGTYIVLTCLYSIYVLLYTRKSGTSLKHLNAFNVAILVGLCTAVAIGSAVWFFTLHERTEFEEIWMQQSPAIQAFLQDSLQCCGYWNASASGHFTASTGFCGTPQVEANATFATACVVPMLQYADNTLNNVFSTVYGIVVIQCCLFLATSCLRADKKEMERFRQIDAKIGRRGGFV